MASGDLELCLHFFVLQPLLVHLSLQPGDDALFLRVVLEERPFFAFPRITVIFPMHHLL